jgi:hypothetical protein
MSYLLIRREVHVARGERISEKNVALFFNLIMHFSAFVFKFLTSTKEIALYSHAAAALSLSLSRFGMGIFIKKLQNGDFPHDCSFTYKLLDPFSADVAQQQHHIQRVSE